MRLYKTPEIDKSRWQNKTEPQKSEQHAKAVTDNKRSVKKVDFSTLEASFKKGLETHHQRNVPFGKNAPGYLDSAPFKELYENIKERSVEIIEKYENGEVRLSSGYVLVGCSLNLITDS